MTYAAPFLGVQDPFGLFQWFLVDYRKRARTKRSEQELSPSGVWPDDGNIKASCGGKGCFTGPQASRLAAHTFYFRDPTVAPPTTSHSRIGDWADWDGWQSSFTNSLICLVPSGGLPSTPVGYTITSLAEKNLRTDQFNVGSFVKSTDTIFIFN